MSEHLKTLLNFELVRNTILILGALGIYLNYRKFGFSVFIRYTIGTTPLGMRVKNLILENNKDKAIFIDGIYACENKDIYIELAKYESPITLKALDIVTLTLPKYSELKVGGANYEPNFFDHFEIFLLVEGQYRKCKLKNKTPQILNASFAIPSHYMFDDEVYNRETKYIFLFTVRDTSKKVFINHNGRVWGDWDRLSSIIIGDLVPSVVVSFLEECEPNIQSFTLYEIQFSNTGSAHPKFELKSQKPKVSQLDLNHSPSKD